MKSLENDKFQFSQLPNGDHITQIKTKKSIIKSHYQIIGYYNIISSIWTWGYAIYYIEKNLTQLSKTITPQTEEEQFFCDNPVFFIPYNKLDILINFILTVLKGERLYPRKVNQNIIEFILLTNIIQEQLVKE